MSYIDPKHQIIYPSELCEYCCFEHYVTLYKYMFPVILFIVFSSPKTEFFSVTAFVVLGTCFIDQTSLKLIE